MDALSLTPEQREWAERHSCASLWRHGRLREWLCDPMQRRMVEAINANKDPTVCGWGRQVGKTWANVVDDCELALQQTGAIIRYCAKTKESAWGIYGPTLEAILGRSLKTGAPLDDANPRMIPADLAPRMEDAHLLVWPKTGSRTYVFGTDAESFQRGRGPRTHKLKLDECGFYQQLEAVEAALLPTLQTTGGVVTYISTPSESPGHPYHQRWLAAQGGGRLMHATIFQNPRVNAEAVIRSECARLGLTREELLRSTYWRREYMSEWVTEESRAAVPSWPAVASECVHELPRPEHFDGYVSLDWGGYSGDPHAALLAFVDFRRGWLCIEDEVEMRGGTLGDLSVRLKAREGERWGVSRWEGTLLGADEWRRSVGWQQWPELLRNVYSEKAPRQPLLRVCDTDEALQAEMLLNHGYALLPTPKHDKHLAVDSLNVLVAAKRFRVHPRCRRLLEQLTTTLWNEKRTEWVRTEKDHGDLVDCAVYLNRNARWNRDPAPPAVDPFAWKPPGPSTTAQSVAALFGVRRAK